MIGAPVELTLWRATYTYTGENGRTGSPPYLFVTADPSGTDALEVLKSITTRLGHKDIALSGLDRLAEAVLGTAIRIGDAAAWPEPGAAGAALLEVTSRQAAVEGELRLELVKLRKLAERMRVAREAVRMRHAPWPELADAFASLDVLDPPKPATEGATT